MDDASRPTDVPRFTVVPTAIVWLPHWDEATLEEKILMVRHHDQLVARLAMGLTLTHPETQESIRHAVVLLEAPSVVARGHGWELLRAWADTHPSRPADLHWPENPKED